MVLRLLQLVWTAFGLASVSAAIWFGLPLTGQEDLARVDLRAALILLVLVVYTITAMVRRWVARKSSAALEKSLTAVQESGSASDTQVLAERMGEAVARLKSTRGKASLHTLPWYIVIGPPGAGKTTALVHSGLAFPSTKPASVSGVGGTRNCDFWFSEDAVLIDTAGRYTTQDSNAAGDAQEWAAFLGELKRFRADQPINGVLLAFSCEDMMRGDDVTLAAHAAAVRARLAELKETLKVRVPVYAIFTKADLVAGFREYFGKLNASARKSVWGVTFQTRDPKDDTQSKVIAEFDQLITRLGDQIPERMADEKDTATRHALMRFPEQMDAMKANLALFLRLIFQGDVGNDAVLRGFYFTSGTQEGTPFDQILGAMLGGQEAGAKGLLSGRGKSYFLHDLLREVVFPERGWVGYDRTRVRFRALFRGVGLAAIAGLTVAAMALVGQGFWTNASLVRAADRQGTFYLREAGPVLREVEVSTDNPRDLLPALALVRDLPGGYRDRPELGLLEQVTGGLGLSQRVGVGQAARGAYSDALERLLRPRMMMTLEQDLAAAVAESDDRRAFEALRVYLLVGKAEGGQGDDLAIQRYFAAAWAPDFVGDDQGYREANRHLAAMLELDARVRPLMPPAAQVVSAAREALAGFSDAEIVLAAVRGQGGRLEPLRPFAGIGAEAGLRVTDGRAVATVVVDPLLTPRGFEAVMAEAIAEAPAVLAREAWVLGRPPVTSAALSTEVAALYSAEIAATWADVLARLEPAPNAGPALGGAMRSVAVAVWEALDFPDSPLIMNDKFEYQAWDALASSAASLSQLERAMAALGEAEDFAEVAEALSALPERAAYPAPMAEMVERAGEAVRAGLVRDEVIGVVLECQSLVKGRYPFAPPGAPPLPMANFAALVAQDGLLAELARAQAARGGIGGALPRPVREVISRGAVLDQVFLSQGSPRRQVAVSLAAASQSVQSVQLRAGDQSLLLTVGAPPQILSWPWADGQGVTLEAVPSLTGVPEVMRLGGGIWSMIPLLTEAEDTRRAGGIIEVAHDIGTRTVILRLDFGGPEIPFLRPELTALRCPEVR